jgi:hypothetical protein
MEEYMMVPTYYPRDLSKTLSLQSEIQAIHEVIIDAFHMAQEVAQGKIAILAHESQMSSICFRIDALFLQHILDVNASEISKRMPRSLSPLNKEHLMHLKKFFQEADLSSACFHNPQKVEDSQKMTVIEKIVTPLQIAYRLHTKRFIKKEIPGYLEKRSCFDYAIHMAGLSIEAFFKFLMSLSRPPTFLDYVEFLKQNGMIEATPPFQAKDIIVYFDGKNAIRHAACVAEKTSQVYAKPGDRFPYAYLHDEEETSFLHGEKFQIYRKK